MKRLERRADAYCRAVRRALPLGGKQRRDYLGALRQDVLQYLSTHPWAGQEELAEQLGSPEQIAEAFLSEMSAAELKDRLLARRRVLRLTFAALGAAMLLLCAALAYMIIRNHQDMNGHFVVTQTTSRQEENHANDF